MTFYPSLDSQSPVPSAVRRLQVVLSYSGEPFFGFQRQPHVPTVQSTLTAAWRIFSGEERDFWGCSRLDAKVNADHFIAAFDTNKTCSTEKILRGLNGILKNTLKAPIFLYAVNEAKGDFHPRFSAVGKHYQYLMWYGWPQHRICDQAWILRGKMDLARLTPFCKQHYEGHKDFAAFRSADCSARKTMRTLDLIRITQDRQLPELWRVDVFGQSFLKNMIRILVGTAIDHCRNRISHEQVERAFATGDRTLTGTCAPGHGLTLKRVFMNTLDYNEHLTLSENAWW